MRSLTPSRGLGRALMMREAYDNGKLVPRSEKGQVRAIDPTRCARRKVLAPTGDEQGWQGNGLAHHPNTHLFPAWFGTGFRVSWVGIRLLSGQPYCSGVYSPLALHTDYETIRELHVDIEIDSLTLWIEKKSFGQLGV